MGWGLLPESDVAPQLERGELVELVPGRRPEIALYWQHWRLGSALVGELTDAVVYAARRWMAT
jgi:LysR family transcriptional regulator (chromosome initiation inhibitor)